MYFEWQRSSSSSDNLSFFNKMNKLKLTYKENIVTVNLGSTASEKNIEIAIHGAFQNVNLNDFEDFYLIDASKEVVTYFPTPPSGDYQLVPLQKTASPPSSPPSSPPRKRQRVQSEREQDHN